MPGTKRLITGSVSHCLQLVAVFFAAIGLSLVIVTSFVAENIPQTRPVTVSESTRESAAASIHVPAAVHDIDGEHELYDGGWAGGPSLSYRPELGWELGRGWSLYDDGWAGGPGPSARRPTAQP